GCRENDLFVFLRPLVSLLLSPARLAVGRGQLFSDGFWFHAILASPAIQSAFSGQTTPGIFLLGVPAGGRFRRGGNGVPAWWRPSGLRAMPCSQGVLHTNASTAYHPTAPAQWRSGEVAFSWT